MPGPPRRRPYPYDAVIAGQGVMLGLKDPSTPMLVAAKVQPFDASAPDDYTYDTMPPLFERVQPYNDLSLGFGLRKQGSYQDKKYRYASGVDCSIAGLIVKGPSITTFTPGTTDATGNGGRGKFFQLGTTLFVAMGRYILKRVNDTSWTVAQDFDPGNTGLIWTLDAVVFSSSDTGTILAWVALNGTNKAQWSTDGTTWVPADGTGAKPDQASLAYCVVGNEFWRASNINQLNKCDINSDPTLASNWTNNNSFYVGGKDSPIVSLIVTAVGSLLALKTDGVYTIDNTTGDQHQLFASLAQGVGADLENGRYSGSFGNDSFFTYGHQLLRATPTVSFGTPRLELSEIGSEKMTSNDSPVTGRHTAFVGNGGMGAYGGLYDDDTGNSFLLKFSSWLDPVISQGQLDEAKRIDSWHGAIDTGQFAGKKITQMTRSAVGAPAVNSHYRLYGACSDGSLFWFNLPCTPNPVACSQYTFTTVDAYLYFPFWTGTFEADAKSLRSVSVLSTNLSTTNSVRFDYKMDPTTGGYTSIGTTFMTAPRERENFPNNTATYLADFRVALISASSTSTPQITAITVHHAVRPALILSYDFRILVGEHLLKRNGSPYKTIGSVALRTAVKGAAAAIGSVNIIFADESNQQLSVVDYREGLSWSVNLRGWTASLDITAVQFTTNTVYGTWGRVGAYRWADLLPYTWGQVAGL